MLTRRDAEPAGAHCSNGGAAIRSGVDRNDNGILDDIEVDHTEYVCDPATAVLVRKDPIEPDAGCPTGGTAVRTGIDANGNDVLDDAEVQSTTEVCSPAEIWDGDFTAADWADPHKVTALLGVRVVAGTLTIATADPVSLPLLELVTGGLDIRASAAPIELPALRAVDGGASVVVAADVAPSVAVLEHLGGDLLIDGPGAAAGHLDAPLLSELRGSLRFGAALQAEVSLPAVRKVDGDIETISDSGVTRIELSGLAQLAGSLRISGNALAELSIPSEHTIGGDLFIQSAFALTDVEIGTTSIAGEMLVSVAPKLVRLAMPHLASVHGTHGFLTAIQLEQLGVPVLEFPALQQTDGIWLDRSDGVTAVRLPSLTTARILRFDDNAALESVSAPEITSLKDLAVNNDEAAIGAGTVHALDFGKLTNVTGALEIAGAKLPDLSGLRNLQSVLLLRLFNVDLLPDLRSLVSIRQVSSLQLSSLPAMTSLDGLDAVTELPFALSLAANDALISVAALRHVTRVGVLQLVSNHALADVALPSMTEITADLTISDMDALQDLTGLAAVRSVAGELMFFLDPGLSDDEIAAFEHQIGR